MCPIKYIIYLLYYTSLKTLKHDKIIQSKGSCYYEILNKQILTAHNFIVYMLNYLNLDEQRSGSNEILGLLPPEGLGLFCL